MYNLDVAAPGDCSSAINPKVQHRPMFLPAFPFLVEPIGFWASTVIRLQEARRHSQRLAELGYFWFQYVRLMAAGFSRLSVMSVGLVERPIPSALLSEPPTTAAPHTTMLPETAARPVSMTMLVFLTTSWWDPRQTLANSTLDNVAGEPRSANLRRTLRPHCKGGVRPHISVGRVFGILHAVFEK